MQLCICINCFLKTHNKQLNQYCLNFTSFFFLSKKKRVLKKLVLDRFGSGQVESRVNPFLLWVKKIKFRLGIFRVESSQKILTRFAMSKFGIVFPIYNTPALKDHLGENDKSFIWDRINKYKDDRKIVFCRMLVERINISSFT